MTDQPHPLHDLAMQIRYDLTAAQGKLTELIRQVAQAEPATVTECELCGYRSAQNMPSLAEHTHTVHDGPMPPHWAAEEVADTRAQADPADADREPTFDG